MSGNRKALIIAMDDYQDPGLGRLRSPSRDAAALSTVLRDPAIGQFSVEIAHNETSNEVAARIEDFFVEAVPSDLLLLHFSGHGIKSEAGQLYFAATNTRPARLRASAVSAEFVHQCMHDSRARSVVLLLDCCYGGAFPSGAAVRSTATVDVIGNFPPEQSTTRGRVVITASSSMEYAFEGGQLSDDQEASPSVFTQALVQGLTTGEADQDEDGLVSMTELYDYLYDRVREVNPNQTPGRNEEMHGQIYIAKSRRMRIRATPLPEELHQALAGSLYERIGAITELRARLVSDDLGIARAAWDALNDMVHHDIQQVAVPAQATLDSARLVTSRTRVSFGDVPRGSHSRERTIRLGGPPLAREITPVSVPAWIDLRQDDDGIHISAHPDAEGPLTGDLVFEGPIGRTAIRVDATVPPAPTPAPPTLPLRFPKVETGGGSNVRHRATASAREFWAWLPGRITLLVVAVTLALTSLILRLTGNGSGGPVSSSTHAVAQAEVQRIFGGASSFHAAGTFRFGSTPVSFDLLGQKPSTYQARLRLNGLTADMITAGGRTFVRGDANYWKGIGRPAMATDYPNTWVQVPPPSSGQRDFTVLDALGNWIEARVRASSSAFFGDASTLRYVDATSPDRISLDRFGQAGPITEPANSPDVQQSDRIGVPGSCVIQSGIGEIARYVPCGEQHTHEIYGDVTPGTTTGSNHQMADLLGAKCREEFAAYVGRSEAESTLVSAVYFPQMPTDDQQTYRCKLRDKSDANGDFEWLVGSMKNSKL